MVDIKRECFTCKYHAASWDDPCCSCMKCYKDGMMTRDKWEVSTEMLLVKKIEAKSW